MEIRLRSPRQFYLLLLLVNCAAAVAAPAAADRNGRPGNKRNDGPIRFGSPFPVAGPIPIGGPRYSPFGTPFVGGGLGPPPPPRGLPIPGLRPPPPYSLVPPPMGRSLGSGINPIHPLAGGSFTAPPIHLHYPMHPGASPHFMSAHQLSSLGHQQGPVPFSTPLQHLSKPIQPSQPLVNSLHHSVSPNFKEGKICHNCEVGKHSTHFEVHDGGPVRQFDSSGHTAHASLQSPGSFADLGIGNFAGGAHGGGGIAAVSGTQGGFLHGGSSDLSGFGARIPGKSPGVSAGSPFGENVFGSSFGGGSSPPGGLGGGFAGSPHPGGGFGGSLHPGGGLGSTGGGGGTPLSVDDGRSSYSSI